MKVGDIVKMRGSDRVCGWIQGTHRDHGDQLVCTIQTFVDSWQEGAVVEVYPQDLEVISTT